MVLPQAGSDFQIGTWEKVLQKRVTTEKAKAKKGRGLRMQKY
jgi:hypothetical protein